MIKNFEDFIGESKSISYIEKSLDSIILDCLKRFEIHGGNNDNDARWQDVDTIFKGNSHDGFQGPDLFINTELTPRDQFYDEVIFIADMFRRDTSGTTRKYFEKRFREYGLAIEKLDADETIVHIDDSEYDKETIATSFDVIDFYRKQDDRIKELEEKLKLHITGKKFGI